MDCAGNHEPCRRHEDGKKNFAAFRFFGAALSGAKPRDRLLSYVNEGQDQRLSVEQRLKELSASRQDIRPGDMMYLQVKMGLAQQEIEYSSTLLSKVISSITTIMNTQL